MNIVDKLASKEDMVSPGISACVGCNVELTLRTCMKVLGPNTIYAVPPGCMGGVGVVGWDTQSGSKIPVFFPLLDNVASMLAGIKMHYEKQGRDVNVVAFAGDGASTDAGMQCPEAGLALLPDCLRRLQKARSEFRLCAGVDFCCQDI